MLPAWGFSLPFFPASPVWPILSSQIPSLLLEPSFCLHLDQWQYQSISTDSTSERITINTSLPAINTLFWRRNTYHLKGKVDTVTPLFLVHYQITLSPFPSAHHTHWWQTLCACTQIRSDDGNCYLRSTNLCCSQNAASLLYRHDHSWHTEFAHSPASLIRFVKQNMLLNLHCFLPVPKLPRFSNSVI